MTRKVGCAALILALATFGSLSLPAQQDGGERVCKFAGEVPWFVGLGECSGNNETIKIPVYTNTRTIVCVEVGDFQRNERDCDGNLLDTIDTIPAQYKINFAENGDCRHGGELQVSNQGQGCYCVSSHRGGYVIQLSVTPGQTDMCDDAGRYTAIATITVVAEPFQDCIDIIGKPNKGNKGNKGNNGVGNGEDGQPLGNPPVNDGEGTGPGNPGNKN